MISSKRELVEIVELAYVHQRDFMNKIMTLLERDEHDKLLHEEMETYINCITVDKPRILALFDADIAKLNVRLEKVKEYHQNTVSGIELMQAETNDLLDKLMKKQLKMMSGLEENTRWTFEELRKFPLTKRMDSPNFESVTFEKLKSLPNDKPVKLERFTTYCEHLTKIELIFSNGLENAAYTTTSFHESHAKYEQTWDNSRQIKQISIRLDHHPAVTGMQFLDEKDDEIVNWEGKSDGTWHQNVIPEGF